MTGFTRAQVGQLLADQKRVTASGCWEWTGALTAAGYGTTREGYTHRISYEQSVGPIPEGLELDHLCRNRACFRPDHLEAVTHAENMRRGLWATKTHCPQGHDYTEENTIINSVNGGRQCRTCKNARRRSGAPRSKTHCPRGHEFTPENTKHEGDGQWRRCVTCSRETKQAYKARKKATA